MASNTRTKRSTIGIVGTAVACLVAGTIANAIICSGLEWKLRKGIGRGSVIADHPGLPWPHQPPEEWKSQAEAMAEDSGFGWTLQHIQGRRRSFLDESGFAGSEDFQHVFMVCRSIGLPWRSLGSWTLMESTGTFATEIECGAWDVRIDSKHKFLLPATPIYPGLILNALFYAALTYALWQLPLAARRALRRTRNQCPRCAYHLAGLPPNSPCPECGTPSNTKTRTTPIN